MMTKGIWKDLIHKKWAFHHLKHPYKSKEEELNDLSWLLIFTILFTPISFILDILFLPFELVYSIARRIILGGDEK